LFCIPHAGVGPSTYYRWSELLGPEFEIVAAHFPGRESRHRERPHTSIAALSAELLAVIRPWLDRPYAIFGHSLGGLVAFELALALRALGVPQPDTLFISAARAPHLRNPFSPLRNLPEIDMLTELNRRYEGSIPAAVLETSELRELFAPALRADLTALETYEPQNVAPLNCPISAFAGAGDATLTRSDVESWSQHTTGPFRFQIFPGGHFFLQTGLAAAVEAIQADLQVRAKLGG
jgi:medium-chain acyl-[acyl-carrier-protein] hydrolase